jgi:hypothetical protein
MPNLPWITILLELVGKVRLTSMFGGMRIGPVLAKISLWGRRRQHCQFAIKEFLSSVDKINEFG